MSYVLNFRLFVSKSDKNWCKIIYFYKNTQIYVAKCFDFFRIANYCLQNGMSPSIYNTKCCYFRSAGRKNTLIDKNIGQIAKKTPA